MKHQHQSGFSMIEVLVTIVVISFGFLSLLSLQMATFNNLSMTNHNFMAISLANDMGERLRANKANASFYNNVDTKKFNKDCSVSQCTMINFDIWQWKQLIAGENQLPEGVGSIAIAGGVATISISWQEKKFEMNSSASPGSYSLQVPL